MSKSFLPSLSIILTLLVPLCASTQVNYQVNYPGVNVSEYLSHYKKDLKLLKNEIFVCTFPKSGSNLTISILSELTGKLTLWISRYPFEPDRAVGILFNRSLASVDQAKSPIIGSHNPQYFQKMVAQKNNKLIITLRNYKELFYKAKRKTSPKLAVFLERYLDLLRLFDNWDEDKRFLVRYETLINNSEAIVMGLADFLQAPDGKAKELVSNFEDVSKRVLNAYNSQGKRTVTDGTYAEFYQFDASRSELLELEKMIKNLDPYLYEKYLKDYAL